MLCVAAVSIVLVVGITCGMDDSEMAPITLISVVLGLRVMCSASLVERVAMSVSPLVSSVLLTSESKLSCGQCLMKF